MHTTELHTTTGITFDGAVIIIVLLAVALVFWYTREVDAYRAVLEEEDDANTVSHVRIFEPPYDWAKQTDDCLS